MDAISAIREFPHDKGEPCNGLNCFVELLERLQIEACRIPPELLGSAAPLQKVDISDKVASGEIEIARQDVPIDEVLDRIDQVLAEESP